VQSCASTEKTVSGDNLLKRGNLGKSWRLGLLLALMTLTIGCHGDDTERLARVGRKVAAKAESLAGDSDGKLSRSWEAMRQGLQEAPLDARVAARLRWDKDLADVHIQVSATGSTVELRGTVRDLAQRRRAVELAQSTLGVEKVSDELQVPEPNS
jgi:hypothetical protein